MNDLVNLFKNISITEEYPYKGYLSEISSPSRLWIQFDDPEFIKLNDDLNEYYEANQFMKCLEIQENQIEVGMKIAAFICGKWHRCTILSPLRHNGRICIFADDYGTKGYCKLEFCRHLPKDFKSIPRKSIRACLHGVAPRNNNRLFDIDTTNVIINFCYNRLFRLKLVHHHLGDDFYEIIACREDGETLNDYLISTGNARPIAENTKFSVFYPPYNLVEQNPFYEPYNHRYLYDKRGVNFNAFENEFFDPNKSYDEQLLGLLQNEKFAAIRKIFESLHFVNI